MARQDFLEYSFQESNKDTERKRSVPEALSELVGEGPETPHQGQETPTLSFSRALKTRTFDSFSWERSGGTYESQSVGAHLVSGMEIHEKKDTFCEKYLGFRAKFLCLQITAWASSSAMTLQVRIPLRVAGELRESTLLTWDTCGHKATELPDASAIG